MTNRSPFAQVAAQLIERGYHPTPLYGKRAFLLNWQNLTLTDEELAEYSNGSGYNVGVLCRDGLVAADIDTDVASIQVAIKSVLPHCDCAKRGKKGETLFYRADGISSTQWKDADGNMMFELLATGKQSAVPPSIHPETNKPYVWTREQALQDVSLSELTELPSDTVARLDAALAPLGVTRGGDNKEHEPLPQGEVENADSPFRQLNNQAYANLEAWVPYLGLYRYERKRDGYKAVATWRESGTGRPQEQRKQNLSITRRGAKDFGTGQTYTAINLVRDARGVSDEEAFVWLSEKLEKEPFQMNLRDNEEPKQQPEPVTRKVLFEFVSDIMVWRGVDRGDYAEMEITWYGKEPCKFSNHAKAVLVPGKTYVTSQIPERSTLKLEWISPIMEYLSKRKLDDAPTFPLDILPPYLRDFCNHYSQSMSAPLDYFPSTLFGCVAGVVGNSHKIIVARESDYTLAIVLWVMLVGEPSQKKSPAISAFVKHLERIQNEIVARNKPKLEEYRKKVRAFERKHKIWESLCDKVDKAVMEAEINNPELPAPSNNKPKEPEPDYGAPPYERRIFIKDATVERIATLSYEHRLGLLAVYDELMTWLGGMNKYANKAAQSDRAFWNQAYDGKSYQYDRVHLGDETINVPHLSVSIVGALQPDHLDSFFAGAKDGLQARFLVAYPEKWKGDPNDPKDFGVFDNNELIAMFQWLLTLDMQRLELDDGTIVYDRNQLVVSDDAWPVLHKARVQWASHNAFYGDAIEQLKIEGQTIRLAAVLTFLWFWERSIKGVNALVNVATPETIEREQMEQAIRVMNEYYVPSYRRAAGPMVQSIERQAAHAVATWLRKRGLKTFNSRDAYRSDGVLTGLVPEKDRPRIIGEACTLLMDAGLIWPSAWNADPEAKVGGGLAGGGKIPKDFDVHPCVWSREHNEHMDKIRAMTSEDWAATIKS